MYIRVYVCMYTYVCMHLCMYVCLSVCIDGLRIFVFGCKCKEKVGVVDAVAPRSWQVESYRGMSTLHLRWRRRRCLQTSDERMVCGVWERRAVRVQQTPAASFVVTLLHLCCISVAATSCARPAASGFILRRKHIPVYIHTHTYIFCGTLCCNSVVTTSWVHVAGWKLRRKQNVGEKEAECETSWEVMRYDV